MEKEEIFKPEELMSQVIAKINELSENVSEESGDEVELEKQSQKALETEAMMVGLDQGNFGNVQTYESFQKHWCEGKYGNEVR